MFTPIFFSAAPSLAKVLTMASGWKHARAARSMPMMSASFSWDLRACARAVKRCMRAHHMRGCSCYACELPMVHLWVCTY